MSEKQSLVVASRMMPFFLILIFYCCSIIRAQIIEDNGGISMSSQCKIHENSINDFYTCVSYADCITNKNSYPMKCTTISELPKMFTEPLPHTSSYETKCKYDSDCMVVMNDRFRWNCCYDQYCQLLEQTTSIQSEYTAINRDWFNTKQFQICKNGIYKCDTSELYKSRECFNKYNNLYGNQLVNGQSIKLKPYCNTLTHTCAYYNTVTTTVLTFQYKSILIGLLMFGVLITAFFMMMKSEFIFGNGPWSWSQSYRYTPLATK